MSFEEAYQEYLIYASRRHKKQSFDTIRQDFSKHILPYFVGKNINELTKLDIINWQNKILDLDFSNNFKLSCKTKFLFEELNSTESGKNTTM